MLKKKNLGKNLSIIILSLFNYSCTSEKLNTSYILEPNKLKIKDSKNNQHIDKTNTKLNDNNKKYLLAGSATIFDTSKDSFEHPSPKLSEEEKEKFEKGEIFFDQKWEVASLDKSKNGLGPFFNSSSCVACHVADGRGRPPKDGEQMETMLLRLSVPGKGKYNEPLPSHNYGGQLQGFSIPDIKPEATVKITYEEIQGKFADGETYTLKKPIYKIENEAYGDFEKDLMISPRVANQMGGLGLLEDINEKDLLALADPDDKNNDGISGRPNYVWDEEKQKVSLGRFGWKSNQPNIRQQVAGAFLGDIGITSPIFPKEEITENQFSKLIGTNYITNNIPEINEEILDSVVVYSKNLSIPARRDVDNLEVIKGEKLFSGLSCNTCHVTDIKSKEEIIHPYTDLLLHDMGDDLADNRPDFMANGNEWRTAPLWTIGLFQKVNGHTNYMHDGRANNLTEAILWHGGEANKSKEKFKQLTKEEREALVSFLNTL